MKLHELRPPVGAHRERRRIGRGHGSGEGPVKVLGDGELAVALTVRVDRVTEQARQKIEAAGGSVVELRTRTEKKSKTKAVAAAPDATPAATGEESAE